MSEISLFQFTTALMRETGMAEHPTPVQCQILDYLENGPNRRVIAAFRGCGKSTLSAIYQLWNLFRNPEEKVLIVSASMSRAESMTAWMLKIISDIPWLRHMQPDSFDGRYSRIAFDVGTCKYIEQSPSVRAAGITGQITGSRASKILVDDCETPTTALTQVQRAKLRNSLNELEAILKPEEGCEIVYLGTPHSATDSIYFTLNRELNYEMQMWPARVPETVTPYRKCLAPLIEKQIGVRTGRPTDTRFSEDELLQRQLSMSPMQWRLQYQLDATLSDIEKYPLRCGDVMVMTIDHLLPEVVIYEKARAYRIDDLACIGMAHDPYFYRPAETDGSVSADDAPTVMVLDPAGGGFDEFAWAVMKVWAGNYFLVASGGRRGGVSETFWRELAVKAKQYHVKEIVVETNFGGLEVYAQVLKPYLIQVGAECTIESIRSTVQKERRIIDTLAPILQTHRFVVDRRVVEKDAEIVSEARDSHQEAYSLFYQMTRLTYEKGSLLHDDRLDAMSMCIEWFQQQAALNQQAQKEARYGEWLDAMIEGWDGYTLMSADRLGMNMTLEQARRAAMADGRGGSWID